MEFQQTNILSMTGNDDFATISDLSNYVDLTTNQTIASGIKTFTTLPQSSAVPSTGNQLVNKTYVDGAFVTLGTTQTITGLKTFSADVRINTSKNLIFGTGTGGIIQYAPVGMIYNNQAGSNHFFFISGLPSVDIDSGGLVIRTGKKVQFYAGSTIYENSGGNAFDTNIPTGYQYNFKINSVDKFKIHPTFGCYVTDDLNLTTQKYITWTGGSFQQEDSAGIKYIYNVPTTYNHAFQVAGVETLKIDATGLLIADNLTSQFGITTCNIGYTSATTSLNYKLPAGAYTHRWFAGTNEKMALGGSTGLVLTNIDLWIPNNQFVRFDLSGCRINGDATGDLNYNAGNLSTKKHNFFINSVKQLELDVTLGATFTGGIRMKAGQAIFPDDTFTGGSISSGGSGGIRFDADVGANFRFINDSTLALTIDGTNITIPSNQTLQFGVTDSNISYQVGTTSMRFKVPAGSYSHKWFNGTTEVMNLAYTTLSTLNLLTNNSTINIGTTSICTLKQDTATTSFRMDAPSGYVLRMRINATTQVLVNTSGISVTGGYCTKLGSSGAFQTSFFNNAWTFPNYTAYIDTTNIGNYTISDIRIKKNIVEARPVLDRLCKLSMIEYNYIENGLFKDDGIRHYGYIAQEIKAEFPEFPNLTIGEDTDMTEDGHIQPIRVNAEFSNLFMGAVIELNAKVEQQQKQIEAQQAQIDGLLVAMAKLLSP